MKKFLIKLVLFLSPFIVSVFVELFILPIDFFTFRVWEALRITGNMLSTGKFYPGMKIEKVEVGALARNTASSVHRKVTWITDEYGYRNSQAYDKPDVVIIGDSFIAGDTLSQEELLSEMLQSKVGLKVYAMAPANIRNYLSDPRFMDNPPEVLVFESIERGLDSRSIRPPEDDSEFRNWMQIRQKLSRNKVISRLDILKDRAFKWTMLEYARARIGEFLYGGYTLAVRGRDFSDGNAFFFRPAIQEKTIPRQEIPKLIEILKEYERVLAKRGTRLIFLPIPGKRTIYGEFVPDMGKSSFAEIVASIKASGIQTVNLYEAFTQARSRDKSLLLYRLDDSHWSPQAVEITAESLAPFVQKIVAGSN